MSMHTQLIRGLFALPVTALLALIGALAPDERSPDCAAVVVPHVAPSAHAAVASELPPVVIVRRTRLPEG